MRGVGVTLVRRVCSFCNGNEGFRLWRWSGRPFVTTHTLCRRCAIEHGVLEPGGPEGATAR